MNYNVEGLFWWQVEFVSGKNLPESGKQLPESKKSRARTETLTVWSLVTLGGNPNAATFELSSWNEVSTDISKWRYIANISTKMFEPQSNTKQNDWTNLFECNYVKINWGWNISWIPVILHSQICSNSNSISFLFCFLRYLWTSTLLEDTGQKFGCKWESNGSSKSWFSTVQLEFQVQR